MKKSAVNAMVSGLQKGGSTTKVSPWFFEERRGEKVEVRYVGLKLDQDWEQIFSTKNLILLAFSYTKSFQNLDVYLANATPFVKLMNFPLEEGSKIQTMLGELRRVLKSDKLAVLHHKDQVGNLYKKIERDLKK